MMSIFTLWVLDLLEKREGRAIEIHEYQSLSTPPYARFKNFSKNLLTNSQVEEFFK